MIWATCGIQRREVHFSRYPLAESHSAHFLPWPSKERALIHPSRASALWEAVNRMLIHTHRSRFRELPESEERTSEQLNTLNDVRQ